jgi:hypothetical protein
MSLESYRRKPYLSNLYIDYLLRRLENSINIFVRESEMIKLGLTYDEYVEQIRSHGFSIILKQKGVLISKPKEA